MTYRIKSWIFPIILGFLLSDGKIADASPDSAGLQLVINSNQSVYSPTDLVIISVKIQNMNSHDVIVIFSSIIPQGFEGWPETELSFTVKNGNGKIFDKKDSKKTSYKRIPPSLVDFLKLYPLDFFGSHFSLSSGPFAYSFKKGNYKVKAQLRFRAADWLQKMIIEGKVKEEELSFPLRDVFVGTIESEEIEIEIK